MRAHPFFFLMASLAALTGRADVLEGATATQPIGVPEEVIVAAPEPLYVAPTLRDRIGRVWAPVYLNGIGPFRLVLDTGANRSAITPPIAMRIGVPTMTRTARLLGVTGSAIVPMIQVNSIEVGDLLLDRRNVAVINEAFGGADGVLGADGLSDKRVFIDFLNDEIRIQHSRRRAERRGFTRIPVELRHGHLLMFDVRVAGVRTKAMLDTGAQVTIGNESLREALAKRYRRGVMHSIVGVTLDVQEGEAFEAPPVAIGDVNISGMRVTFGDFRIFEAWNLNGDPALLIGMDVIGLLDTLIIDYKHEELLLRTRDHASAKRAAARQRSSASRL